MIKSCIFYSRYKPCTSATSLDNSLERFSHFYGLSNQQKMYSLFENYINIAYIQTFNKKPHSLESAWGDLRKRLHEIPNVEDLKELGATSCSMDEMNKAARNLAKLIDISFAVNGKVNQVLDPEWFPVNKDDGKWFWEKPNIPLTTHNRNNLEDIRELIDQCPYKEGRPNRASTLQSFALLNGNRDSAAAMMLTTRFIENNTLFYEVGCWNGTHSLNNLAYCGSLRKKFPKYYVGTDINYSGLGISKMSLSYFNMPLIKADFFMANARHPLGLISNYSADRIGDIVKSCVSATEHIL